MKNRFEEGKRYKLTDKKLFLESCDVYNSVILRTIGTNEFTVVETDKFGVLEIEIDGLTVEPDDIDPDLMIILYNNEREFFTEIDEECKCGTDVKPEDERYVLVQVLNDIKSVSLPLSKEEVDKNVKGFLLKNPTGKVEIYTLYQTASTGIFYQ